MTPEEIAAAEAAKAAAAKSAEEGQPEPTANAESLGLTPEQIANLSKIVGSSAPDTDKSPIDMSEHFKQLQESNEADRAELASLKEQMNTILKHVAKDEPAKEEPTTLESILENKNPEDKISVAEAMKLAEDAATERFKSLEEKVNNFQKENSELELAKATVHQEYMASEEWKQNKDQPLYEGSLTTLADEEARARASGNWQILNAFAMKHYSGYNKETALPGGGSSKPRGVTPANDELGNALNTLDDMLSSKNPAERNKADEIIRNLKV